MIDSLPIPNVIATAYLSAVLPALGVLVLVRRSPSQACLAAPLHRIHRKVPQNRDVVGQLQLDADHLGALAYLIKLIVRHHPVWDVPFQADYLCIFRRDISGERPQRRCAIDVFTPPGHHLLRKLVPVAFDREVLQIICGIVWVEIIPLNFRIIHDRCHEFSDSPISNKSSIILGVNRNPNGREGGGHIRVAYTLKIKTQ